MQADRSNRIVFCQIHAGRANEAARECWKSVRKGENLAVSMFVLVRLYAEANQLDDLRQLSDHFVQESLDAANSNDGTDRSLTHRYLVHQERAKSLARVLEMLNSADWNDAIKLLPHSEEPSERIDLRKFEGRAARWQLMRNRDSSRTSIIAAARSNEKQFGELASLLAADDSEVARAALVDLAALDVSRRLAIIQLVRIYSSDPEAVVSRIAERVPDDRTRYVQSSPEPRPFTAKLIQEWPRPAAGALPTVRHLKIRQAK